MTFVTEHLLHCDGGKDCPEEGPQNVDSDRTLPKSKIRDIARLYSDWVCINNKDYCPSCANRLGKANA